MHPNDPLYPQQWHLTRLGNIEKIWDEYSGAGVHVGIYDNGVESAHPDLTANYDPTLHVTIAGVLQSGEVDPVAQTDPRSRGHGTAVAGIVGAAADNGDGGVGIAWGSSLTSVNIANSLIGNPGNGDALIEAIEQMVNFDVTNNSWNRDDPFYLPTDNLNEPTAYVLREVNAYAVVSETGRGGLGTVIVQGVGNDGLEVQGNGLNSTRYTISVAGYGPDGYVSAYSNYGAAILVTAPTSPGLTFTPGAHIVTTDLTGTDGYNTDNGTDPASYTNAFGGTSGSGPMVTGVVALMLQANPGLGWRDVQNILAASATHTGSAIGAVTPGLNEHGNWLLNDAASWNGGGMHFSNDYGYGAVNAYNAVRLAEVWSLFQPAQITGNEYSWWTWEWGGDVVTTGVPIPDSGSVTDTLTIAPTPYDIELEHVDVIIDFQHQDFTDLRIFLTSPQGTEIQIYDGTGGTDATADSELKWTFGVDVLRGELVSGQWQLRIEDADGGNAGQLFWWQVTGFGKKVEANALSRNDTYHYTDEFLAAGIAGQGNRGSLADAGGIDWIDAAAVTGNLALRLGAGLASTVNGVTWFTIAGGTLIENAVSGDGNDTLAGNGAANTLYGMRGNDTLDGGAGADALHGGKGNDSYIAESGLDVIDEFQENASGIDTVVASLSFSLANAARVLGDVENLTLVNVAAALSATGNALGNLLTGNNLANTLTGAGGLDSLRGGLGNDTYVLENGSDGIVDTGGIDTATSTISRSIAGYTTVENLTLVNVAAALAGTGNNLANAITGNNFNNTLTGGLGNDTLRGEIGSDVLTGGAGIDTLTGGAGNDFFVFNAPLSAANRDTIADFFAPQDTFRLENAVMTKLGAGVHALSAAFFRAGTAALDANDYVIYNRANGSLSYDSNGNLGGGVTLLAVLTTKPLLTAADFFVI